MLGAYGPQRARLPTFLFLTVVTPLYSLAIRPYEPNSKLHRFEEIDTNSEDATISTARRLATGTTLAAVIGSDV